MIYHIKITIPSWFVFLLLTGCVNAKFTAAPTTVLPSIAPVAASVLPTATPVITSILPTATLPPVVISPITGSPSPTLPTSLTRLSGPYLGQTPPGSSPTVFASEMIYGELHTPPVFSADGSQAYWGMQGQFIYMTRLESGFWTRPEKVAFSPSMTDYRDPFLAPSGDRLYFLSKGVIPGSDLPEKENIWFVKRMGTGWGAPQPLSIEINSYNLHWQVSINNNMDLYFTSRNSAGDDIYFSRYLDGQYVTPVKLGDTVNTVDLDETTPFIAPDGSYLIFSRIRDNGNGPIRLYISYADSDGGWTEAVLIEPIRYGLCPLVSPDGLYLFFLSSPRNVSWMSTGFIEQLKPGASRRDLYHALSQSL